MQRTLKFYSNLEKYGFRIHHAQVCDHVFLYVNMRIGYKTLNYIENLLRNTDLSRSYIFSKKSINSVLNFQTKFYQVPKSKFKANGQVIPEFGSDIQTNRRKKYYFL